MEEFEEFFKEIEEYSGSLESNLSKMNKKDPLKLTKDAEYQKYYYFTDNMVKESYIAMLEQLLGFHVMLPRFITINGVGRYLVSFEDINKMMKENQIEKCIIDPSLQKWAGPTGTQNVFLTFHSKDGKIYIVKAYYDMASGKAFPPIEN